MTLNPTLNLERKKFMFKDLVGFAFLLAAAIPLSAFGANIITLMFAGFGGVYPAKKGSTDEKYFNRSFRHNSYYLILSSSLAITSVVFFATGQNKPYHEVARENNGHLILQDHKGKTVFSGQAKIIEKKNHNYPSGYWKSWRQNRFWFNQVNTQYLVYGYYFSNQNKKIVETDFTGFNFTNGFYIWEREKTQWLDQGHLVYYHH